MFQVYLQETSCIISLCLLYRDSGLQNWITPEKFKYGVHLSISSKKTDMSKSMHQPSSSDICIQRRLHRGKISFKIANIL